MHCFQARAGLIACQAAQRLCRTSQLPCQSCLWVEEGRLASGTHVQCCTAFEQSHHNCNLSDFELEISGFGIP